MPECTAHDPGTFCWTDLMTTDPEAAKKFYGGLFGWTMKDDPMPQGGAYTMLSVGDKRVGGLSAQSTEMQKQGIPPVWNSYIAVESADDAVANAKELGGNIVMPAFDVMEVGRMAVIVDTTGAVFSVWQAKAHHGASLKGEPGSLCWNELSTPDIDKASAFYGGLFNWTANTKSEPMPYTEWHRAGQEHPVGGAMKMEGEMWKGILPHWMVYFSVADADASANKAKELGGTICVPPTDIPRVGRFSVIEDPQGASFSIIVLA
jgi:predicted enzyme related to lactoylglutathione lyase